MDPFNDLKERQRVLAEYDRREQEVNRTLASLAERGPKAFYTVYAKAAKKMMKQINMRRRLFGELNNE